MRQFAEPVFYNCLHNIASILYVCIGILISRLDSSARADIRTQLQHHLPGPFANLSHPLKYKKKIRLNTCMSPNS